jgi:predicted esterase
MSLTSDQVRQGRLTFRPAAAPLADAPGGPTGHLEVDSGSGAPAARIYVPSTDEPLRLVVLLHGAGGVPSGGLDLMQEQADTHRLLLLAPKSAGGSWDVIQGGYGRDVEAVDGLLAQLAGTYPLRGYAIGGFSDGASYALSLGTANGDLFDAVVAFSPGFSAALAEHGHPRFFVTHGTEDMVLPIDRCSRRIVPALQRAGYDVDYREFPGGHVLPASLRRSAADWVVLGDRSS